jgi:hypothetical protein
MRSSDSGSFLSSEKSQTRQRRSAVTNFVECRSSLDRTPGFYMTGMLERTGSTTGAPTSLRSPSPSAANARATAAQLVCTASHVR